MEQILTNETSVAKIDFTIVDGRINNIAIVFKDEIAFPPAYLDDHITVSNWLSAISMQLLRIIGKPPVEPIVVTTPQTIEKINMEDQLCRRCSGKLEKTKPCCGSNAPIYQCKDCGAQYRLHERGKVRVPLDGPVF